MSIGRRASYGAVAALLTMSAAPALAQEAGEKPRGALHFSANAGIVSDYRFRGISLSARDPAVQGGIDLAHDSGFFAGVWASSIADYGGANTELDIYGGYGGSIGPVDYTVTALGYVYPGGRNVAYFELMGSLATAAGPATLGLDLGWIPDQDNFGGDNLYLAGSAEVALGESPFSIFGRLGMEDGDVYDSKWDWEAGLSFSVHEKVTATVSYVDTNYDGPDEVGRLGRAGVVSTLVVSF